MVPLNDINKKEKKTKSLEFKELRKEQFSLPLYAKCFT